MCQIFHFCMIIFFIKVLFLRCSILVKMTKQEETRRIIISKYLENPQKSVKMIAKELNFPNSTTSDVIKRYKETLSISRKPGSGGNRVVTDPKLAQKLVKYVEKNPNKSEREMAIKFNMSKSWIHKMLVKHNLRSFKVQKSVNRTDQQAQRAKTRARNLYDTLLRGKKRCVVMDDESYVVADFSQLPGRAFYHARVRFGVARRFKYQSLTKFATKYMIWQAICSCGRKSAVYIAKGTMNANIYIQECLKKRLLPFLKSHDVPPLFWPDLARIHYAKQTLQWYSENEVTYVPVNLNPPNCPQLRPIETYWALVKQKLKKDQKKAKSANSFQKLWLAAAQKVDNSLVQRLMSGLNMKVCKFGRMAVDDQL